MIKKLSLIALPVLCLGLVVFVFTNRIIEEKQVACGKWELIRDFPFEPGTMGGYANAIAAVSRDDVWVVGAGETRSRELENYSYLRVRDQSGPSIWPLILHWDGKALNTQSLDDLSINTDAALVDIVAVSTNDVWAIGYYQVPEKTTPYEYHPLIIHWDGKTWSVVPSPQISWEGRVGDSWTGSYSYYGYGPGLNAIEAVSKDDIWIVGHYDDNGDKVKALVEHWDGNQWKIVPVPTLENCYCSLSTLAVKSADDVWASNGYTISGSANSIQTETGWEAWLYLHWDGKEWSRTKDPNVVNDSYLPGVYIGGQEDNWIASMLSISPTDVWAVGEHNAVEARVYHWDGKEWAKMSAPTPSFTWDGKKIVLTGLDIDSSTTKDDSGSQRLRDVEVVAPNEIWTVGAHAPGDDIWEYVTSPLVARYVACPGTTSNK